MVQYYTLEQAAELLRTTPDLLKEMARKKEVRAFQDRSGWRFRAQEIDELARARGYGSDPELPLGEAAARKGGDSGGKEVFNFSLDANDSAEVPIGKEPTGTGKPSSRTPSGSPKPANSKLSSRSPRPKQSSDSDVRLVMDGSAMDFSIDLDSKAPVSKAPISPAPKVGSGKSRLGGPAKDDSGVRIVPLDDANDSDVKVRPSSPHDSDIPIGDQPAKRPSDSDIRIEEITPKGSREQMVTEEIDLDAEARKADAAAKAKGTRHRPKPQGSAPKLPTSSPFELSEDDLNMDGPTIPPPSRRAAEEAPGETDSSSDFELKPLGDDSSPLVPGSDEMPVLMGDDEVGLGELTGAKGGSGINLQDPADSGISLEQGGSDEIEFELSLDSGTTPKPKPVSEAQPDSSSEFELSLSDDDGSPTDGSSSEFELSLDPEESDLAIDEGSSDLALETPASDSDSEFELSLDEGGDLSVEKAAESDEDKDIFETDFEVPALDEESGSEAVALDEADTDLESSEFDLSLDGEESGSQVVPLEDEEEADEGAATVQRAAAGAVEDDDDLADIGDALDDDLDQEPAEEEDEELEPVAVSTAPAPPAEWGALPALVMLPCTILLFVVGLMSFELVQGMWGYHRGSKVSNLVIKPIAKMFDEKLPDD